MAIIALGLAGKEPILRDFLEHQLGEKLKKNTNGDEDDKRRGGLWWNTASITGAVIAIFCTAQSSWQTKFKISSVLMGAMYLLFYSGFLCFYPERKTPTPTPTGSPLITIYRVLKEAFKKRSLPYPRSKKGYYSNNNAEDHGFYRIDDEVHLLPQVPSFLLFLDKAAISRNLVEMEEREIELCKQVREVKSLYPAIPLVFTFFAYTLVSAAGNTYFIEQTSNLSPSYIGYLEVSIIVLFVLKSSIRFVVTTIQSTKQLLKPKASIGFGLFCAVVCSLTAWGVERRRLQLIRKEGDEGSISLHMMVLCPQYLLLGMMEGFAEEGLLTLLYDQVPESMVNFVQPCVGMVLGIGALSSILCALIFRSWFKESINTSHLDNYFLMLAVLSFLFFFIYVCYCGRLETKDGNGTAIAEEEPRT